jgi:hypothetical protein
MCSFKRALKYRLEVTQEKVSIADSCLCIFDVFSVACCVGSFDAKTPSIKDKGTT